DPLQIDDDALSLIDAWRDFLSSWTMVRSIGVVSFLLRKIILTYSVLVQTTFHRFAQYHRCKSSIGKFNNFASKQWRQPIHQNHQQTIQSFATHFFKLERKHHRIA